MKHEVSRGVVLGRPAPLDTDAHPPVEKSVAMAAGPRKRPYMAEKAESDPGEGQADIVRGGASVFISARDQLVCP